MGAVLYERVNSIMCKQREHAEAFPDEAPHVWWRRRMEAKGIVGIVVWVNSIRIVLLGACSYSFESTVSKERTH